MTLTIDLQPDVERGLAARAHAQGVSLADLAQEILTRAALPSVEQHPAGGGRELIDAGANVRGLFTDEEIDSLLGRTSSISRPVDFS